MMTVGKYPARFFQSYYSDASPEMFVEVKCVEVVGADHACASDDAKGNGREDKIPPQTMNGFI
jgi:hypothetical protein